MVRAKHLVIALTSLTLLALELVWTRLFSAEFFYTFAFLTLSLAVMGLGIGALVLRLVPAWGHERHLGKWLCLTALMALIGPPLVFRLGMDFSLLFSSWAAIGKFVAVILLLSSAFFFGGMALALVFKRHSESIPTLYWADLTGAGLGVFVAIIAMNALGTQSAASWAALPVLLAAVLVARGWRKLIPLVLVAGTALAGSQADALLRQEREERGRVIYEHWDAMAKIKLYDFGGQYRGINIDNVANSPVIPFDGVWEEAESDSEETGWAINVKYLVDQFDECTFLSLGSGGGGDVLQALDHGATEVHAVEVIPHINRMLTEGDPVGYTVRDSVTTDSTGQIITCADYSGRIYHDPRVTVVSEDARAYVRRHRNKFDVIYSLSSNTWAAFGSGAFALAENYLFTTEAFRDYWDALTDDGFLSMEHQVYMPRLASEVLHALRGAGVESPEDHIAIYALPKLRRQLLLLSKRPLTDEIRGMAYGELTPEKHESIHLLYPAADSLQENLIHQIVTRGWQVVADTAHIDVSPSTDNRPFVAQMGLWRNLDRDKLQKVSNYAEFGGFPLSMMILAIILAVVIVLMIPLMILPFAVSTRKLSAAGWFYFLVIGMAFMAIEVILIQKYTLFIGASVYALATVLLTLLVSAGIGSRFAPHAATTTPFAGILVWLLLDSLAFGGVAGALAGLEVLPRVLIAAAWIAPLGFFMGMPFPRGVLRVGDLVDWGFAVNGIGSVLGATAIVMCAFAFGFNIALATAGLLYLVALGLMLRGAPWVSSPPESPASMDPPDAVSPASNPAG